MYRTRGMTDRLDVLAFAAFLLVLDLIGAACERYGWDGDGRPTPDLGEAA